MAGVSGGPSFGGGRRKTLDAELNLVPFIDLLSMCISFLLLTAVWINIGAVQLKQSHGTDAPPSLAKQYEMDLVYTGPTVLEVRLKRGSASKKYSIKGASHEEVMNRLNSSIETWAETKDPQNIASARITPALQVSYGDMIDTLDVLRKHRIVNLAVLPGGGGGT